MNTMRKTLNNILVILALIIMLPNLTMAEGTPAAPQPGASCANQKPTTPDVVTCCNLNHPNNQLIISINEESIGSPKDSEKSSTTDTKILQCLRKTTCTPKTESKPATPEPSETTTGTPPASTKTLEKVECVSEYVEIGDCTPTLPQQGSGSTVTCNRVQAFISVGGIDMLFTYISLIYRWGVGMVGSVSVAYLIYGGFLILTSGDDSSKLDSAKEKVIQSLGGLILLFLSAIILYTINPTFFTL